MESSAEMRAAAQKRALPRLQRILELTDMGVRQAEIARMWGTSRQRVWELLQRARALREKGEVVIIPKKKEEKQQDATHTSD